MLSDALSFPRRGDDWIPTLLVGGILTLLSPLVIPIIILQGYLVRVLAAGGTNEQLPPSFTQWGRLVIDGLKLFVVNLVYGIAITVPLLFVLGALLFAIPAEPVPTAPDAVPPSPGGSSALGLLAAVGTVVVVSLFALVATFVLPAAFANFAIEGRLGAAFDLRTVLSGAFTSEYAVAWVLALVVGLVGGLIGSALSVVIVGVFVLFYIQVSAYYLLGRGFAAGLAKKRMS